MDQSWMDGQTDDGWVDEMMGRTREESRVGRPTTTSCAWRRGVLGLDPTAE